MGTLNDLLYVCKSSNLFIPVVVCHIQIDLLYNVEDSGSFHLRDEENAWMNSEIS